MKYIIGMSVIVVLLLAFALSNLMTETTIAEQFNYRYMPPPETGIDAGQLQAYNLKEDILERAVKFANSKEFIINVYDCTQFSRDFKKILKKEYGIGSAKIVKYINCSYTDYWDVDLCTGWHSFLYVYMPDRNDFYLETVAGWEITEDMYPMYNLKTLIRK